MQRLLRIVRITTPICMFINAVAMIILVIHLLNKAENSPNVSKKENFVYIKE